MLYRVATKDDLKQILKMKENVKKRIIKQNLPMWLYGYPLDEYIIDDVTSNEGRVIEIDGKVVSYSCFHHASKEYGNGVFKKDNVMSFGRLMVDDEYVGKQIGDYMVQSMIEEAKSLNVEGVGILADDFNVKAMNLYKKYGFEIEGARQFPFAYLTILGLYFN